MTRALGHCAVFLLSGGGEEEGPAAFLGLPFAVWQAVSLVLFFALLVYLLKKPVAEFFAKRSLDVAEALEKAAADRRRAEEIAAELGQRLARLESEVATLRVQADLQAQREAEELESAAGEEARRVVTRASAEMDNRVRSARHELTAYAADLAVDIAREVLEKAVTPADRDRLFQEAVSDLAARSGK